MEEKVEDPIRFKRIKASNIDLAVLIHHIYLCRQDQNIGFLDAHYTADQVVDEFNSNHYYLRSKIESALWACNMLAEKGKFWHPNGMSFESFLKKLGLWEIFDRKYNVLTDRE